VFLAHSNIAECAAIAVQAEHSEDEVMVVIVTKDGQLIPYEELMAYCVQRMPYFAVPRYVLFENELPKTANEKIRKDVLRKQGITTSTWDRERAGYKISR
jgi:crotonobetaine/carnitine-CoA ligase